MISNNALEHEHCHIHPNKCISWTAIFIGALIALGLGLLFGLLGAVIGLNSLKTVNSGSIVFSLGGMLGVIVCVIVATAISGYITGYLGRLHCSKHHHLGIVYGFITWVSSLILGAILLGILSQNLVAYSNIARTVVAIPVPITQITTPVGSTKISSSTENGEKVTVVEVNVTPADLASGAFLAFLLFFLGAMFSCLGAHWGMRCNRNSCNRNNDK
ncbi:Uncharacterised protein [Legionella sainthelensi]|uniref:Uncharacterized protein n=1 Tax=Legionella sainthelensi TaxID=28087 RepID=A0A2H5FPW0_9GAMM|nr:hypothetical protein [Legionella sainthelensi]AUH73628.1 hypothetical protein CAB17_17435 [Legionella sainthelensi]VEB37318.1 Uncharacterised protein [Legionella sainthelensi]